MNHIEFKASLFHLNSTADSEDEVREVKSHKDRAWDSMKDCVGKIRNAMKNNDWSLVQDEFANVNKLVEKSKMLIVQSGIPNFYVRMLAELEDGVLTASKDKEGIKKLKPATTKALNQLKSQVRKHNESYKEQISDFKANPTKYEESVEVVQTKSSKRVSC